MTSTEPSDVTESTNAEGEACDAPSESIDDLRKERDDALKELAEARKECDAKQNQLERSRKEIEDQKKEIMRLSSENELLKKQLESAKKREEEKQQELQQQQRQQQQQQQQERQQTRQEPEDDKPVVIPENAGLYKPKEVTDVRGKKEIESEKQAIESIAKQWRGAGSKVGLEIWRIESFKVVPQRRNTFGTFYAGDSYIVLNTYKRSGSGSLAWDIHFWIGKDSTQDEVGTAAYKTVELDDFLGGVPVQHREVQGHESKLFQSYFPHGLRFMEGGVDSGFNKVKPKEYKPRLLQLKGKRRVRLVEVPLEAKSVNSGDVFILDVGMQLIQFNGKESCGRERLKAAEVCRALNDERGSIPKILVFEEFSNVEEWPKEWVSHLGTGPYASAAEGGDDLEFEKETSTRELYRLSDASGTLEMTKVAEGSAVTRDKLDGNDVFVLDLGNELFTWIGLGASRQERRLAMTHAVEYLEKNNRNTFIPITVTMEGAESKYFWSFFSQ